MRCRAALFTLVTDMKGVELHRCVYVCVCCVCACVCVCVCVCERERERERERGVKTYLFPSVCVMAISSVLRWCFSGTSSRPRSS